MNCKDNDLALASLDTPPQRIPTLASNCQKYQMQTGSKMAPIDWSQCSAVESVPGRLCGAWVFCNTRMPVSAVFGNLEAGATIDEITEWFDISKEQINVVLRFVVYSLNPSYRHAFTATPPNS